MGLGRILRILLALAATLVVAWAFVDVGARTVRGSDPRKRAVTLTILHWGNPAEADVVAKLVARYEETHPDVRVQRLHASDYDAKLKTMFAAGTPPDLFYLNYEAMPEMASMGLLMDLEPHLARERERPGGGKWAEDFYPILLNAFRYDGKHGGTGPLYALPKDCTPYVMYVNVELFNAAGVKVPYDGWTWKQFDVAIKRITALSAPGKPVHGGVFNSWQQVVRAMIWTHGGEIFGGGGGAFEDVVLDEPPALAALEFIRRTRFDDHTVLHAAGVGKDGAQEFFTGNVGVIGPFGRWMTPRFREIAKNPNEAERFEWDVVPLPHADDVKPVTGIAVVGWAGSASTKHPEETFDLMKYLCGPDGQRDSAQLGLAVPTLMSVAREPGLVHGDNQPPRNGKLFLDALEQGRLAQVPRFREWDRMFEDTANVCIHLDQQTPAQAAATFEQRWISLLASPLKQEGYSRMPWRRVGIIAAGAVILAAALLAWHARREKLGPLDRAAQRAGWAFIAPWLIGFLALTLGPMVVSALYRLHAGQA